MEPVVEATARDLRAARPVKIPLERLEFFPPRPTRAPAAPAAQNAWSQARMVRAMNVAFAVILVLLTAPLMLLITLLIKFTSPGPALYTQIRVGIDKRPPSPDEPYSGRRKVNFGGKLFRIYKFRTMTMTTNRKLQIWAMPDDSRVTPLGRILRQYRLDELPQLFNVLKGDMNLVGPRPEQPNIFMSLREQIDRYADRQRVLPGITGLAQINHHYDRTVDDVSTKLMYDLQYTERQSCLYDLRIILRTVPAVLLRRGGW